MSIPLEAADSRPMLLFVHGAFFGAWSWDAVRQDLLGRGWESQTVDLPSVADRGSARVGLYEDVEVVHRRIKEIGGPVVVVAHSYGGVVVTQAAAELPNVRHLVYVCGFQLDVGESLLGFIGEAPDWWNIEGDILSAHDPRAVFLHDVPQETAVQAVARLKPVSLCVASQKLTLAAWRTIPSTYIVADEDKAILPVGQEFLAKRAAARVHHLPSGHLPLLSMPSALAGLIVEAVDATTAFESRGPVEQPRGADVRDRRACRGSDRLRRPPRNHLLRRRFDMTHQPRDYLYGGDFAEERARLAGIEALWDPGSQSLLDELGLGAGWRCLEVGAGGGSLVEWMARRGAEVTAVDIDTRFIEHLASDTVDVRCLDIRSDDLPAGGFDLVHARLLLEHLADRKNILRKLAGVLRPGGWIVIEDYDFSCFSFGDQPHFHATVRAITEFMEAAGFDPTFGRKVVDGLVDAGLTDVRGEGRTRIIDVHSPGFAFFKLSFESIREAVVAAGALAASDADATAARLADKSVRIFTPIVMAGIGRRA